MELNKTSDIKELSRAEKRKIKEEEDKKKSLVVTGFQRPHSRSSIVTCNNCTNMAKNHIHHGGPDWCYKLKKVIYKPITTANSCSEYEKET